MRFSIWSAVSTVAQAEGWDKPDEEKDASDRSSLPEQEKACRAAGLAKGWRETSGPYIVPGESRTRWVNLRDAESEIPQLRAMLEDGKRGLYDVLTIYDYNRLRDLLDPVAKTLASYGIQIYSVSQPVEPLPAEEFLPYSSDSESMMRGMSQIISRWQINDLKRKFRYGVTARVRKGLPSLRVPYGYSKPPGRQEDSKAVPVQIPDKARHAITIKEMYLAGGTYYDIKNYFLSKGIPSPQGAKEWSHTTIKKILRNPFYAGKVFFGRSRVVRDPNGNTMRLVSNPNPLIADGKHQPLWSWEEHLSILSEMERRGDLGHNNRYAFSGLLKCSVCGATLHHDHGIWRCSPRDHITLHMDMALALIPRVLQKVLFDINPVAPSTSGTRPSMDSALADLDRQRRRVQAAYESEVYTVEEAEKRIRSIEAQINELKDGEATQLRKQIEREQFLATLDQARELLANLPQWIKDDDPKRINSILLRLCKEIVISPDYQITVHLLE